MGAVPAFSAIAVLISFSPVHIFSLLVVTVTEGNIVGTTVIEILVDFTMAGFGHVLNADFFNQKAIWISILPMKPYILEEAIKLIYLKFKGHSGLIPLHLVQLLPLLKQYGFLTSKGLQHFLFN